MRNPSSRILPVLILFVFSAILAGGQITNLVDWNTEWRYYQSGEMPAADWASTNYSDADWPSASGVFGTPTNEMLRLPGLQITTPLSLTANGSSIISYYFRTTFELASTNRLLLVASNLIDDGAVIYLNGREVRRLGMPVGPVHYTTYATRTAELATQGVERYDIPITNIVAGSNVLAVEVHQVAPNNSDVVFGMKLTAEVLQPPVILQDLEDLTVLQGRRGTFTLNATGSPPLAYRWSYGLPPDVKRTVTSHPVFTTMISTVTMNGWQYSCVVSNQLGMATSRVATLTVIPDTFGPRLLGATQRQTNQIEVLWDETINRQSAQVSSNYTLRIVGTTNAVEITNVLSGVNLARLTLAQNLDANRDYVVCARNIQDVTSNITASDCIGVTFMLSNTPVSMASSWNFATPFTGTPTTNWAQVDYVLEDFWGERPAMFAHETTHPFNPPCTVFQTHLITGLNTYYFRRTFTLPANLRADAVAVLRYVVDDGAVFYLNGRELLRVRMPAAPITITKDTFATIAVLDATCATSSIEIPAGLLRTGTNVLAVEVHQALDEEGQTDVAFDAELAFFYPRTRIFPGLTITSTRDTNGKLTRIDAAWWDNTWQLETAPDINGPWTIQPANGTLFQAFQAPPSDQRKFFRLKGP